MRALPGRDDRGSLSLFAAVTTPALLLLIGLGVDGGNGYRQHQRADAYAAEAARAGAQAIAPSTLLSGKALQVDKTKAITAADAYLTSVGLTGTVGVDPVKRTITVDIDLTYSTQFLFAVGKPTMTVHGHAVAVLLHGLTAPEPK